MANHPFLPAPLWGLLNNMAWEKLFGVLLFFLPIILSSKLWNKYFFSIQVGPESPQHLWLMISKERAKNETFVCIIVCENRFPARWHQYLYIWWRHFDSMAVFLRQCHFQNLPFLSQKSLLTTEFFHCLASPGKVSALALKNEDSMNKEKHSLCYFAVL